MSTEELDIQDSEEQEGLDSDDYQDHQQIVIDPKQAPLRIDKFLMDRLMKVSRNRLQNAIRSGSILVDDKEVKPNFKVKPGQVITLILPKPPQEHLGPVQPEDIPLDIRYEDDDLMVVYKPPGMVVHPGVGHPNGTLVNALAYHFKDLPVMKGNDPDRIGLVHRIDKNTSGLLVVAKTDYSMTHLAKQFYNHTVDRTYQALVWGEPDPPNGTITANVGRHPRFRKLFTVFPEGDEGKWAVTHYKTLEGMYYVSLIECRLETGRTHQIRIHMQHLGHPLFSDDKYGGDQIVKGTVFSKYKKFVENCFTVMPRQALHAKSLGFTHPVSGERLHFETDLPEDFAAVMEKWRTYVNSRKTL
ncbi:RluA family pseudouridine synthase [Flavilitoribacter nigricans]|uniref:Pseudouridine synthase n=1 Tax=Flavilitoribacter nigricans (strain ATCC 23147 / DSM 23189 / NBRC 102662 / NCIMB 1420 / SS-2) TaxID=1122177 RepID=A0A2D0NE56_FLAN2|nr:RluA family pseudouridine synthase [Flavilitoribacter nigricans]PHN06469.1 RNA pseudouridine synthase [Flavilitoribacter nigricans DSM 23189 = NBRC 102662]